MSACKYDWARIFTSCQHHAFVTLWSIFKILCKIFTNKIIFYVFFCEGVIRCGQQQIRKEEGSGRGGTCGRDSATVPLQSSVRGHSDVNSNGFHFDLIYLNAELYIYIITISYNILHEFFKFLSTNYTLILFVAFLNQSFE